MIDFARVVAVDWKSHTVDLKMSGDGRLFRAVRVMSSSASSDSGLSDLPKPGAVDSVTGLPKTNSDRGVIAVVALSRSWRFIATSLLSSASFIRKPRSFV
jgi:hypothetical protein